MRVIQNGIVYEKSMKSKKKYRPKKKHLKKIFILCFVILIRKYLLKTLHQERREKERNTKKWGHSILHLDGNLKKN
jgi:hypothetical protein